MDVTVVNTPLPVSAEIRVKNTQIPFNLIIPLPARTGNILGPIPTQSLVIKEANTDYDLVINYAYASDISYSTISLGMAGAPVFGFGLTISDSKSINIQLCSNESGHPGVMTSIVVTKEQRCSFYLGSPANGDLRANIFVSGFIYRQ